MCDENWEQMYRLAMDHYYKVGDHYRLLVANVAKLVDRGLQSQDYDEAIGVFYEMRDLLQLEE